MKSQQRAPGAMQLEHSDADCEIRDQRRNEFHETCVMMMCFAPASSMDFAIDSAKLTFTNAIMFPPRPPPLSFAPNAPALRAAETSLSSSGDETVISCRRL